MGYGVCTADDPQGKNTEVKPNGTIGRVYTQELRAETRSRAELAESNRRFQRELMCQDGVVGAIACNRPFIEFDGFEAGASLGPLGTGVSTDGTKDGTGSTGGALGTGRGPSVYAGLCVRIKGAPKHKHSVSVGGSLGYGYASVDPVNQGACIGGQFPPGAGAFVSAK